MIRARMQKEFVASHESAGFTLDVEFEAAPGVTVLFGPSGSGKTLTLNTIAGFASPRTGRIMINDRILYDSGAHVNIAPRHRRCGYVFQNYALFPHMTLRENLAFAADTLPRLERHRRIGESLERFHLTPLAGRYPRQLSGGEQQRGSIARALLAQPEILLLDEPARGLDQQLREELNGIIAGLRGLQIPILLVTHDVDEMLAVADHVLVYDAGHIVQRGTASGLLHNPGTEHVARLMGDYNFFDGEVRGLDPGRNTSRLHISNASGLAEDIVGPYLPGCFIGDKVHLCARPEEFLLHDKPGQNRVRAERPVAVQRAQSVSVRFGNGLTAEVPRDAWSELAETEPLWVEIPAQSLRQLKRSL